MALKKRISSKDMIKDIIIIGIVGCFTTFTTASMAAEPGENKLMDFYLVANSENGQWIWLCESRRSKITIYRMFKYLCETM